MAQSAYERYPDPAQYQRYPDENGPPYSYPSQSPQTYPDYRDQQYRAPQYQGAYQPPSNTALDQAYRDGYRAGYWVGRRSQTYDDRRPDYRGTYNYRR